MQTVSVESQIEKIVGSINALPEQVSQAAIFALNRTAEWMKGQVASGISKEKRLKLKLIRDRIVWCTPKIRPEVEVLGSIIYRKVIIMSNSYSAEFKSRVALLALKEEMPTSELSKTYKVPASVINRWRREASEVLAQCFNSKRESALAEAEEKIENLEKKIGQLTMDNDFLKKNYVKYYRK
jgi:transposase-like protein